MQRRNEETTVQQAARRVWHAEEDKQVEEQEEWEGRVEGGWQGKL